MAKVKYATGLIPLLNKHFGAIFQPNYTNQTMKSDSSGARSRLQNQTQKQQGLMKAIRMWRNMTTTVKNNWNTFAATYPQASRRNPAIFLTGYQLFLKRNHYCFLNHGIDCNFMEEPTLEELPEPNFSFSIEDSDNVIDVTELYISNFGIIPQIGQYVLIRIFPMSENSGIFFTPIKQVIEVTESYIDGLFVSLAFTSDVQDITFSVYLSKVVHQSTNYVGTKVRYMGCFTPKTFKALTDTPDSYAGQSGKIPAVKETEDGLEFIDGGGGGISCEDLINCPLIIEMLSATENNSIAIAGLGIQSNPPVKFGLLYNLWFDPVNNPPLPTGWRLPTYAETGTLYTFLGGNPGAGGKLKETGLVYWYPTNFGATNEKKFNARGAGYRTHGTGTFSLLGSRTYYACSDILASTYIRGFELRHSDDYMIRSYFQRVWGFSIRGVKISTTLSEGESGFMVGNSGRVYRTICLNGLEWMADNCAEVTLQDGTLIPEITDNAAWAALTTPGLCAYNNDWSNV